MALELPGIRPIRGLRRSEIITTDLMRWEADLPVHAWRWTGQEITNTEKFRRAGITPPSLKEVV